MKILYSFSFCFLVWTYLVACIETTDSWTDCDGSASNVRVYLSVSALAFTAPDGTITQRQLELNWYGGTPQPDDVVGLYSEDPSATEKPSPLVQVYPMSHPGGWYTTEIEYGRPDLSTFNSSRCLGFWIAYYRNDSSLDVSCLMARPNWMWEHRQELGHWRLIDLVIPGTHDSGAYEFYRGAIGDNQVTRYAIAQEETIYDQLMYGVRYLDLRPGLYSDTEEKYWLNHGPYRIRPFSDITGQLLRYIKISKDLFFLELSGWEGEFDKYPEEKDKFIDILENQFGQWLAPSSLGQTATLSEFLDSGKRVIMTNSVHKSGDTLSWDYDDMASSYEGDDSPEKLMNHLDDYLETTPLPCLWLLSGEQTPTDADAIFDRLEGLRVMADQVDRNITRRIHAEWWPKVSIVLDDFFLAANNVDVAIESNLRRYMCNVTNPY